MTCALPSRLCAILTLCCGSLLAVDVAPELDDAPLRSVFFTTSLDGCAVGASGTIWLTRDAGRTWELKASPVPGLHESVSFVNKKTGWIVGSSTMPTNQLPLGYVLQTTDGGETWTLLAGRPERDPKSPTSGLRYLPRLRAVRFFTSKIGFAVGASNRFYPTGVLKTTDGGQTWTGIPGDTGSWRCGWFMNPDTGFVAGRLSSRGAIQGERVVNSPDNLRGLQTWRSVRVSSTNPSWMVGDGAEVLYSADGGITWGDPPQPLPQSLSGFCDFHALATRRANVWIAGSPGSVIWHSPDSGTTWQRQETGQTTAIRALHFSDATNGCAVGDMGAILVTADGGKTWTGVKGNNRRVALLAVSGRSLRVPFEVMAKHTAEHGYRSAVFLPVRADIGPDGSPSEDCEDQLREAVASITGSVAEYGWRFPTAIPGIDRIEKQLLGDWQQRSEGKLAQALLSMLVAKLRTERPDVLVLDEVSADDAVTRVMNTALLRAVEMAADPGHFIEQQELGGLSPWKVRRVYQRVPDGSRAQIEIAPHDVLRTRATTVSGACGPAYSLVSGGEATPPGRVGFRRVVPPLTEGETRGDFFRGLNISPGSSARRRTVPANDTTTARLTQLAERQRNLAGYTDKFLADERMGAQLLAQLDELTQDLPDAAAARELRLLTDKYAEVQKWSLAAATMLDLVKRYPHTTEASFAREWLIAYWAGAEPSWQRRRKSAAGGTIKLTGAQSGVERSSGVIQPVATERLPVTYTPGDVVAAEDETRSKLITNWRESALRMSAELKQFDPLRLDSSRMQMRVAALLRVKGNRAGAMSIYSSQYHEAAWRRAAAQEVWVNQMAAQSPDAVVTLRRAAEPPKLDGLLSDPVWRTARELWLRGEDLDTAQGSYAAMAYDDEYLYLAAAVRRHPSTRDVREVAGRRDYDADLGDHDRVSWCLDTDRDYATWYRFEIDQRGFTTDRCWVDQNWNPKWYAASSSDETHWRFEAAVPLEELVPHATRPQETWAVGITRFLPGHGVSAWNQPAGSVIRPERFGLAVFGR